MRPRPIEVFSELASLKAWKNYATIRRAYCNRKATVQQLAHALALVGVAEVKAEIAS